MRRSALSNEYLATFCMEIAMLLCSGVPAAEGLSLMMEDEADADRRALLAQLSDTVGQGQPLSLALSEAKQFPAYLIHMVQTGERAGRSEETFRALAAHYENQHRLNTQIRYALLHPSILMLLMLVVIAVILMQVMPIFDQAFAQLGIKMSGIAGGLLRVGELLSAMMPLLLLLLFLAAGFLIALNMSERFCHRMVAGWGEGGMQAKISAARFASALSIGMASGLPMSESLDLASLFSEKVPQIAEKSRTCRAQISTGAGLADSLRQSGIFSARYCQLIAIGVKSGNGSLAMAEAARLMEDEAETYLERRVQRIEPAMVIVVSALIGLILLAAMLPLIQIMSAMG